MIANELLDNTIMFVTGASFSRHDPESGENEGNDGDHP
jgi:hypothetical protein